MTIVENKALVLHIVEELWNEHNLDVIDQYFHPDFRNVDPANFLITDRESLKEFSRQLFEAFPDWHATVHELVAEDNRVVKVWSVEGNFKNDIFTIPANHKPIRYSGINLYRLKDGLVIEEIWAQDFMGLMEQLGVAD